MKVLFVLVSLALTASSAPTPGQDIPVGTILAWSGSDLTHIPQGWELCNGQVVDDVASPFNGQTLPPLNTENLFLRGASTSKEIGQVQGSALPQHGHTSEGHTHLDRGHTHEDAGHTHEANFDKSMEVLVAGITWGDGNGKPRFASEAKWSRDDEINGRANVMVGKAVLSVGNAVVSDPVDAVTDSEESRPKNVRLPFIIKVKNVVGGNVPAGVVVATLPQNQDKTSEWKAMTLLNEVELFLRGGSLSESGQVQHDALQVHSHKDEGHTHRDLGHAHMDRGHKHEFLDKEGRDIYLLVPGSTWGDQNGNPKFAQERDVTKDMSMGHADIQEANANIMTDREVIGQATGVNTGAETRPKNLRVFYQESTTVFSSLDSFPVGTILPWIPTEAATLPTGWYRCDGTTEGVPDLRQRYLRGSPANMAGSMEGAMVKAHTHNDLGHTHTDVGHKHEDEGHFNRRNVLIPGTAYGDGNGTPRFASKSTENIPKSVAMAKADITEGFANLEKSKAVIGDVTKAEAADELRLKNVAVEFIMRKQ